MGRDSFVHQHLHTEPKEAIADETRLQQQVSFEPPYRPHGAGITKQEKAKSSYSLRTANNGRRSEPAPLLTMQDACAYLQCWRRFLERKVRSGRVRALKPSCKFVRFRQSDLDAFLESGATIGG
jgi:excisionase family DNA binding protein